MMTSNGVKVELVHKAAFVIGASTLAYNHESSGAGARHQGLISYDAGKGAVDLYATSKLENYIASLNLTDHDDSVCVEFLLRIL